LQEHLDRGLGCEYIPISCPNNCGSILNRKTIQDHMDLECELREYLCEYCDQSCNYKDMESHYEMCTQFPVECPKECGQTIERCNLDNHKFECDMEERNCSFYDFGCFQRVPKRYFEDHLEDDVHTHLDLLVSRFTMLKSSTDTLHNNLNELCAKQIIETRRTDELEQRMQQNSRKIEAMEKTNDKPRSVLVGCFFILFIWCAILSFFLFTK